MFVVSAPDIGGVVSLQFFSKINISGTSPYGGRRFPNGGPHGDRGTKKIVFVVSAPDIWEGRLSSVFL